MRLPWEFQRLGRRRLHAVVKFTPERVSMAEETPRLRGPVEG